MSDTNTMAFEPLLNNYIGMKLVRYFGLAIQVPANVQYIATDEDGGLYGFLAKDENDKPEAFGVNWSNNSCLYSYLGKYKYNGDWKQSLQEV